MNYLYDSVSNEINNTIIYMEWGGKYTIHGTVGCGELSDMDGIRLNRIV